MAGREDRRAAVIVSQFSTNNRAAPFIRAWRGNASFGSVRTQTAAAVGAVKVVDGAPTLILSNDGSIVFYWQTRDGGPGLQYLDGEPWKRYLISG